MSSAPDIPADIRPVLVVGQIRSGTKWLSNLLCNHPLIAGVQSERTLGIIETNMFDRMQTKFDLRSADDYVGFIELWRHTEFVRCSGVDVSFLYGLDPRPRTFVRIFDDTMRLVARERGASHWLQKCGPASAERLLRELDGPRLVLIMRDELSIARSIRNMSRNRDQHFSILKALPQIVYTQRQIRALARHEGAVLVSYDELKRDTGSALQRVCSQLGVDYDPSMLKVSYGPNTSFPAGEAGGRKASASGLEKLIVKALHMLPMPVLRQILKLRKKKSLPRPLVPGTFSSLKAPLADRRDYY